jgi:LacI family transcriptional regulator
MTDRNPTLRDVANRAGVSLGTASNVLNNKANVSPGSRAKVLEAAALLGYQPQVRVSTPLGRKLSVIGVIGKIDESGGLAVNPFYSYVLAGVERECQRQNLSLMYANIEVDSLNRPAYLPPMLQDKQVDGILMVGTFLQDTIHVISRKLDKPVVLVDAYAPGSRFDSVVIDNINGAYAAVTYLIKQGHTRIGLVGSIPDAYPSIRERRKGYVRALKHNGITETYIEDSPLTREGGYNATCALLRRAPRVTAIFACNDEVAMGVLSAAREMGRTVPNDLSLIGFDDIDLAQEANPALTTIHVDKVWIGVLAVRYLKDRAEDPGRPALTTALSTQLIVRESVRPLNE